MARRAARRARPDYLWAWRLARWALLLLAAAGVALTMLPLLPGDAWWIRYPDYPRLQIGAGMVAVLTLLLLLPYPRREWPVLLGAVALLAALAESGVRLAPYLAPAAVDWPQTVPGAPDCPADRRLRVLAANVQMTNQVDHRLLDMVRRTDPDVAWFQETNARWEQELSPLAEGLPHGVKQIQDNFYGVHLFSRLTLSRTEVRTLTNSANPSVTTDVELPSGDRVRLYAIHPRPPQVGQGTAERDAQLMATALAAHDDTIPHLIVGDLNTVPWEAVLARTAEVAAVRDPRIGRGLFVTWNANRSVLKWPLDHVLPGPGLRLIRLHVLPDFGSDHYPLLADLCLVDTEVVPQPLDPARLEAVRATIARGQGKADAPGAAVPPSAEMGDKDG